MKDERDTELLALFAERQRPIDGDDFTLTLLAQIEKESARSHRLKSALLASLLLLSASVVPFLVRASIALLPSMDGWVAASDVAPLWILIPMLAIVAGFGSIWRLVRGAS